MAKQKRKPVQQAPITANPLFPAVVALWFGALFGLGSLAVRPSLIEDLVLTSRIDLVIPAAAPPLGMTARIMLALIMAVIGAVIGVMLARRLTRPKQEHRERSRNVVGEKAAATQNRARDAHPDAPSCKPISMRDIDPDAAQRPAEQAGAARRRGLTADQTEDQFVPHDFAPLPGGGEPQILDLARGGPPMVAPLSAAVVESGIATEAAQSAADLIAAPALPVQADLAVAAPQMPFAPTASVAEPLEGMPDHALETAAAHADGRQVFGMQPAEPQTEKPRQIFGQAVDGDHVPQDFVRDAGYRTTVFEQEVPTPLFNRDPEGAAPVSQDASFAAPVAAPAMAAPVPQAYEPLPAAPTPAPAPLELTEMVPAPVQAAAPVIPAAPAEPLPSPAGLEMTDLASRLAESMRRRRAAKAGTPVVEAEPAPVPTAFAAPQPMAFEAPAAPVFEASVPEAPVPAAPVPAAYVPPLTSQPAMPEPAPVPQAFVPQLAPVPQAFVPEPAPVPQAFVPEPEPVPTPQPAAFAPPAAAPVAAAPAGLELPSALRPLALDAFLEDDSQFDSSLLPPRHIAMPAPAAPAPIAQAAPEPMASFAPAPAAVPDAVPGEEAVVEENYASLLGIGQARAGFVRIEEAEPDLSDPEPVVIFPGQAPLGHAPIGQAQINPAAAPSPVTPFTAPDNAAFRRFDSPATAGSGQPVDMGSAPQSVPATEAEQALRSALASLQRISGAA